MRLFVGDDWAEEHHDVEVMDSAGRRLVKGRLPEGVAGIARLHAMIGEQLGEDADEDDAGQVAVGIETDRGPWVQALVAAGYTVYAVNPLQASRYRERHAVSGAKSDAGDAHVLADMVRTDSHQLRTVAGDTAQAAAVKVVTRTHKTLIWERTRHAHRLRHALRDYFPAALEAFEDLDAPDALELLARAPDPASAARLTTAQISAALKRARRHHIAAKANQIQAVLRAPHLGQPAIVTAAYAASARALIAVLATLNEQVTNLQGQVEAYFGQHPDAEIILSQPGPGIQSSAPGCSQNPATTPAGTPPPKPGRTTPAPAPSPAPPERRKPSPPGTCATTGSSTRSWPRPSPPSTPPPEHAPATTTSAPAAPATTPPSASSPTGSPASSTAASKPAPSTTRQPPGRRPQPSRRKPQLDI